ncbi:MAG: hypothetical protein Q8Q90_00630 [bacterium]|nr:hypothetical protein [bacterium]
MTKLFYDVLGVITPQDWGSFAWGAVISFVLCFVLFGMVLFFMSAGRSGERIDRVFEDNQNRNTVMEPTSQTRV